MRTSKQREDEFRQDFAALLEKHKAEFCVTDDGAPWGAQCGIVIVSMASQYSTDLNLVADFAQFELRATDIIHASGNEPSTPV
jgi:hypothetical protein